MKLVTAKEMQRIDRATIQEVGIPGCVLMENAGRAVAAAIREQVPTHSHPVWIFSGKGNNGGDGFVIARYLREWGYPVQVMLLADAEKSTGDAALHLRVIQNLGLPIETIEDTDRLASLAWKTPGLVVDCVFGTGLRGAVRGFAAEVIEAINNSGKPVLAVDIPSGLNADTGIAEGACVRAEHTVTIGLPKRGLLFAPEVGELTVVDIGFPESMVELQGIQVQEITHGTARERLPVRPKHSHKGSFGRALIVAGSTGMTGAATLCTEAALRAGSGLVTLASPASLNPTLEMKLTEAMTLPLPETAIGAIAWAALEPILDSASRVDVLAIGPGLSQHPETVRIVQHLCTHVRTPSVIDADALNALSQRRDTLDQLSPSAVLTPHLGEMARLLGETVEAVRRDVITVAQTFASQYGIVLVLKGAPTVVAAPDGHVWVNTSGNPGMATGGTGDVLTGLIAGFMAQGLSALDAAVLGVYIHGCAGDRAADQLGMHAMLAGDVLAMVPDVLRGLGTSVPGR